MGMAGECTPGHEIVRDRSNLATVLGSAGGRSGLVAVIDGDVDSWLGTNHSLTDNADAVSVVSVGESVRSTAAAEPTQTTPLPDVIGVSDATDLGTLGRNVSDYISTYASQGKQPVVVFDAIEPLLEAAGLEAAFRVLHLLSARTDAENGRFITVLPESMKRDEAETLAALAD